MTSVSRSAPTGGHRLALIGAGWISAYHLAALERLGRTRLVAVASGTLAGAARTSAAHGGAAYPTSELERLLDEQRPELAVVAVPPVAAVAILERLVERGIPFLTEKPLAATDGDGPAACRRRDRGPRPGRGRRLPPARARSPGRGPGEPGREPGPAGQRPLVRLHAAAGVVAPRGERRRPGDRAGDPFLRPGPAPRRRGDGRRRGGRPGRSRSCPTASTWSMPRPRCCASTPVPWAASPTAAGWLRR